MKLAALNIAIGIVIGILLSILFFKPKTQIIENERIIRDTILVDKEPIMINTKPKIIYKKDTILLTKPFTVKLDTIIKFDTVKVYYEYPENDLSIVVKRKPDTLITNTIIITNFKEIKRPLYIDILTHTGTFLLGYTLR